MTSQTLSPSFSDLKNLSSSETISSRKAVEVTLKSFEACEVSEQEILNTWCRILFQKYGPCGITDDSDLNKLFDLFSKAIKELLDECGNCENDEQIEKLNHFLSYSLELFTWIHSKASEFKTNVISAFLCFGLLSIHTYLIVLCKQTSQVSVTKLIEKSLQIHNVILGILTSQPKTFIFAANNTYLGSLISNLCLVGEIVPKLDIKSAVETWKCVTRLASQNLSLAQKSNDVVWLAKPMSFLIKEIGRNVQTVYTQDSLSEPIQQIEKFLKITNFYLRLLQKLTVDFRNVPFPICEEFIGTLAIVLNPPIYIAGTPVYKVIMDSIGNDLKEMIPLAYRNKSFFEQLLSEHIGNINSKGTIHEIVLQVLEIIFLKDEPKYVNDLLDAFFKYVSDGSLLVSNSIYKRFVIIFSSFQIRFNDERIIKKLVSTVLQEDTIQALAAIDIWCTIFMQTDDPTRQSYIQFWIQMNQLFPTFSTNVSALHTELLLKNLYTLLSAEEKDDILKDTHSCIRRDRLFLSLGLEMLPCTPIKQSVIKHFQRELQRLLTKTRSEFTIEIYYSIVKALKLLKSFKTDQPTEMLFGQLETALEDKQLYLMVENSLEFLNIDNASGQNIQRILNIIKMNISLFDELSTKLCFVRFTNRVAKQNRFEAICQEILMVLENDEELKQLKFLEAKNSRFKEDREGNCDELWKELIENHRCSVERIRSHTCGLEKVTHSVVLDNSRRDVEELLLSLEHNVSKLEARTRNIKLSEPNIEIIKRSVFKLKGMICE